MLVQHLIYFILWIIVSAFSIFLRIWITVNEITFSNENNIAAKYDYIIVGGGSAGSVLAGRLSEISNVTVLLIEAGNEGFDMLNIPVLGSLKQLTVMDWQYKTIPQKHSCHGLENNVSRWPSGKVLGGSTHLNYMIYHTGHSKDYESWKESNSHHWSSSDIQFYFEKAKKCSEINKGKANKENTGSINVRSVVHSTKLSEAVLQGAKEMGYKVSNTGTDRTTGFMKPQLHLNEFGMRWTSDQFMRKFKRNNLKVMTNTVAEEILFRNGFEAHAVRVRSYGVEKVVFANLEIIVAAGTVGSSKLLMLSGIGPRDSLLNASIPTKVDLPVGKNLQDHVTTGLDLGILKNHIFSYVDLMTPSSAYEYFIHGRGPYTSGLVDAIGIIHSKLVDPEHSSPDLEFMVMMAGVSSDKGVFFRKSMGISNKAWNEYFQYLTNESVISILPVLLHPKSKGQITLDYRNPRGMPRIDPNYLSNEGDVTTLVEGIKIVRRMMETEALRKFGLKFNGKNFPGCSAWEFGSSEYWRCYVRHLTLTVYHPVGTCKMADYTNGGVVDFRLRVHKTNKLRVIDASVMPSLPSANPMPAVIMIAEKGADLIKEDFHRRFSTCQKVETFLVRRICS